MKMISNVGLKAKPFSTRISQALTGTIDLALGTGEYDSLARFGRGTLSAQVICIEELHCSATGFFNAAPPQRPNCAVADNSIFTVLNTQSAAQCQPLMTMMTEILLVRLSNDFCLSDTDTRQDPRMAAPKMSSTIPYAMRRSMRGMPIQISKEMLTMRARRIVLQTRARRLMGKMALENEIRERTQPYPRIDHPSKMLRIPSSRP